jgi:septal ring factor EnvC (AmiA/AmiB activator)
MAERKLTRAGVVKEAFALAELVHSNPAGALAEIAAHLRASGADPDQILRQHQTAQAQGFEQQVQQIAAAADAQISQFAATRADFDQVREAMGAAMERATDRGQEMTLEQAYQAATRQGKAPGSRASQAATTQTSTKEAHAGRTVRELLEIGANEMGLT